MVLHFICKLYPQETSMGQKFQSDALKSCFQVFVFAILVSWFGEMHRVAHSVFLYCPARVCWKYWGCECEVSRMQLLYFGCILHNGHPVKSGAQLWLDSQQRSACPRPSEPGTESLGWDPLAACQHIIVLLDSQCSHWLTLGFTFSAASVDSHISSLVPCQGFSCFQWRTELDKQHPVSVSWTSPQLEDNSWFLFFFLLSDSKLYLF